MCSSDGASIGANEDIQVAGTETRAAALRRCTLCPAGCQLDLAACGPDNWRAEYPLQAGGGVCPRGSAIGELLGHRQRILTARDGTGSQLSLDSALASILSAAEGKKVILLLDGNVPTEEMAAAAFWCQAWHAAELCLFVEPAEESLLAGIEASGAEYLSDSALSECGGFVIIGDAFAANPICSRGVFDRRKANPRTPIVVIDSGVGSAAKFATHRIACPPGAELWALQALAQAAGVDVRTPSSEPKPNIESAEVAGAALKGCKRLGVPIAAEYGRTAYFKQIGFAAGKLAAALDGGVAPQTTGANAMAAVRLASQLGAISTAQALSADGAVLVAVGCDVLGALGRDDLEIFATAAALPNRTTEQAQIVLPMAMPGELTGTFLLAGAQPAQVEPLLAPPAGVPTGSQLIASLASQAGVAAPSIKPVAVQARPEVAAPSMAVPAWADAAAPLLVLGRQAIEAGCGELTGNASFQQAVNPLPELRMAPSDAQATGIKNLEEVTVQASERSIRARARIAPELQAGTIVLPEGSAEARSLNPSGVETDSDALVAKPISVSVSVSDG